MLLQTFIWNNIQCRDKVGNDFILIFQKFMTSSDSIYHHEIHHSSIITI